MNLARAKVSRLKKFGLDQAESSTTDGVLHNNFLQYLVIDSQT